VSAVQIRRFAAEARQGTEDVNNTRLRDALQKLQTLLVEFNYLQSDGTVWESMTLLGPSRIARDGTLTYTFHPALLEKLIEPALYSYLSLRVIYQFESKYGLALYEILKRYSDRNAAAPYWQVQTEVLRELLGCSGRLKDWKDFRRYALDPAMAEIGEIAEFRVELDEVRQGGGRGGGKVVGCVFRIIKKGREEAEEAAWQIDKPRVQRRGERLSHKAPIKSKVAELAIQFLDGADAVTRRQWAERARELGVRLPAAAGSRETLSAWVPAVAELVCREHGLT
jgi:plasmid replication initiation protein